MAWFVNGVRHVTTTAPVLTMFSCFYRVKALIENIDFGYPGNPMSVLICLTEPEI